MIVVALSLLIVTGICGNGTNEIKASNSLTNKTAVTKIAKAKRKHENLLQSNIIKL